MSEETKQLPVYKLDFYDEHGNVNNENPDVVKIEIPIGLVASKPDFNRIIFLMGFLKHAENLVMNAVTVKKLRNEQAKLIVPANVPVNGVPLSVH